MTITPEQLAEWERLAGEATEGPWLLTGHSISTPTPYRAFGSCGCCGYAELAEGDPDAAFIAAARSAVPILCQRVRDLERQLLETQAEASTLRCLAP